MNYKYIWAWEILKGTTSADIVRGIVSLAREENAPARAIMRLHDGRWLTLEDLSNEELVQQIEDEAKTMMYRQTTTTRYPIHTSVRIWCWYWWYLKVISI